MSAVDTPRNPLPPRSSVVPPTVPSRAAASVQVTSVRIGEDGFAPEATVDAWIRAGAVVRAGNLLTLNDGRRYQLQDAVRVIGRRDSDTDPYGFTGRVDPIRELIRRGASISADALRLGPAVYDIEYGFLLTLDVSRL